MLKHTKYELPDVHRRATTRLMVHCGGPVHLAKMLGVPFHRVNSWAVRGRVSRDGVDIIAKHPKLKDKFSIEILRPELSDSTPI